jgi:hypothetical protein
MIIATTVTYPIGLGGQIALSGLFSFPAGAGELGTAASRNLVRPLGRPRQRLHYGDQHFKSICQFAGLFVAQRFRKQ